MGPIAVLSPGRSRPSREDSRRAGDALGQLLERHDRVEVGMGVLGVSPAQGLPGVESAAVEGALRDRLDRALTPQLGGRARGEGGDVAEMLAWVVEGVDPG